MAETFVLDRAAILDRLGGDEEIYAMMLDMYLNDYRSNCGALQAALAAADASSVRREAHTIKGLLATFSDDGGARDALLIEQRAKVGELAGLEQPVADICRRLHEVAGVLASSVGR